MPKKGKGNKNKEDGDELAASAPKGKKERKTDEGMEDSGDESDSSDASHVSLEGDLPELGQEKLVDEEVSESAEEIIERKLNENLENATNKTASVRVEALKILQGTLSRYYIPDILEKWKVTMADVAERALNKRAGEEESGRGANLSALLAVQMGLEAKDLVGKLVTIVRSYVADASMDAKFRADCAVVLGVCLFLAEEELEPTIRAIATLREIWTSVKAGGGIPNETIPLFCSSVCTWGMLVSQLPETQMSEIIKNDLPLLCSYLESSQVDSRVDAGETLALLYELGREASPDFKPDNHQHTVEILSALATDSLKYHAKRDRRTQRASFRQIYAAINKGEPPTLKVKFDGEILMLKSWAEKFYYDAFCAVLRGGMNFHLKLNPVFREIFELGPLKVEKLSRAERKLNKLEEKAMHALIAKARKLQRGRQRDKRVASMEMD